MHFGGVGQKYPSLIWPKNKARWYVNTTKKWS